MSDSLYAMPAPSLAIEPPAFTPAPAAPQITPASLPEYNQPFSYTGSNPSGGGDTTGLVQAADPIATPDNSSGFYASPNATMPSASPSYGTSQPSFTIPTPQPDTSNLTSYNTLGSGIDPMVGITPDTMSFLPNAPVQAYSPPPDAPTMNAYDPSSPLLTTANGTVTTFDPNTGASTSDPLGAAGSPPPPTDAQYAKAASSGAMALINGARLLAENGDPITNTTNVVKNLVSGMGAFQAVGTELAGTQLGIGPVNGAGRTDATTIMQGMDQTSGAANLGILPAGSFQNDTNYAMPTVYGFSEGG